ncbi:MAG: hypothetical protein OXI44_01255 [Bacteroidota bacterium]|nr:hypothetical protein [Bacteroidota bacterium]
MKNPSRIVGQYTTRAPSANEAIENRLDAVTNGHFDDGRLTVAIVCKTVIEVLFVTQTYRTKKAHHLFELCRLLLKDSRDRHYAGVAEVTKILR